MARWAHGNPTWTPTATADATNLVDSSHDTLQGGSATCRYETREVYLGGQAGSSAPTFMVFGRTSQVGSGALAGVTRLAALDPATAGLASVPLPYTTAATNKPQRSATVGILLNLSFNAFGGIVRWVNGPDEIISLLGNAQPLGELSLNAYTGGTVGLLGSNLVFETL